MKYQEILSLLRKKEKKGLEMLYSEYGNRLYGFAVERWSFTEDEAWEVIYKTLDTLLKKVDKYEFDSKQHFENFLFKVYKNNLAALYRYKKRNDENIQFLHFEQIELCNDENQIMDNLSYLDTEAIKKYYSEDSIDSSFDNPLLVQLNTALGKLSMEEQDILLLRAQNFSYREISQMLGIEGQLKVKHLRAKRKLIELIQTKTAHKNKNHGRTD